MVIPVEIYGFNPAERKEVTRIVADQVKGRALVIGAVSSEGTFEAMEHAKDQEEAGADAIMLMPAHIWLRFVHETRSSGRILQGCCRRD